MATADEICKGETLVLGGVKSPVLRLMALFIIFTISAEEISTPHEKQWVPSRMRNLKGRQSEVKQMEAEPKDSDQLNAVSSKPSEAKQEAGLLEKGSSQLNITPSSVSIEGLTTDDSAVQLTDSRWARSIYDNETC